MKTHIIDLLNAIEKNDYSFFGLNIENKTKVAEKQSIFLSNNNGFNSIILSVSGSGKSVFSETMAMELLLLKDKKEKVIDNIEKIKKERKNIQIQQNIRYIRNCF